MTNLPLDDLNPAQRDAVTTVEGPLLVLAGAGSGKTRVLTHRIAHLVRDLGVSPAAILAITFTNKAAGEMRERLEGLIGSAARPMWVMTFHAFCVRLLRADGGRLGYTRSFTIYDEDDSRRLLTSVLAELDVDPKRFPPRGVAARISSAKNELIGPGEYEEKAAVPPEKVTAKAYRLYQQRLRQANAMDFDDLLMEAERLLVMAPAIGVMQRILERCVTHARQRKVGSVPIGRHQAIAHRTGLGLRFQQNQIDLIQVFLCPEFFAVALIVLLTIRFTALRR